jgi:hypothetical protein
MTVEAQADARDRGVRPELLHVSAYLAPWVAFSFFLPEPHRALAVGLLALLGVLLACAGVWCRRYAEAAGLDGAAWSFAGVATLGFAMLVLLVWTPRADETLPTYLCDGCGRLGAAHEPFCFGCGAHA